MTNELKSVYRPGWPTRPDGSFTVGPGEAAWRTFLEVATDEQVHQAIEVLEALGETKEQEQ